MSDTCSHVVEDASTRARWPASAPPARAADPWKSLPKKTALHFQTLWINCIQAFSGSEMSAVTFASPILALSTCHVYRATCHALSWHGGAFSLFRLSCVRLQGNVRSLTLSSPSLPFCSFPRPLSHSKCVWPCSFCTLLSLSFSSSFAFPFPLPLSSLLSFNNSISLLFFLCFSVLFPFLLSSCLCPSLPLQCFLPWFCPVLNLSFPLSYISPSSLFSPSPLPLSLSLLQFRNWRAGRSPIKSSDKATLTKSKRNRVYCSPSTSKKYCSLCYQIKGKRSCHDETCHYFSKKHDVR